MPHEADRRAVLDRFIDRFRKVGAGRDDHGIGQFFLGDVAGDAVDRADIVPFRLFFQVMDPLPDLQNSQNGAGDGRIRADGGPFGHPDLAFLPVDRFQNKVQRLFVQRPFHRHKLADVFQQDVDLLAPLQQHVSAVEGRGKVCLRRSLRQGIEQQRFRLIIIKALIQLFLEISQRSVNDAVLRDEILMGQYIVPNDCHGPVLRRKEILQIDLAAAGPVLGQNGDQKQRGHDGKTDDDRQSVFSFFSARRHGHSTSLTDRDDYTIAFPDCKV